jgi:N-acetylmuramoyl-L-alanine amidase
VLQVVGERRITAAEIMRGILHLALMSVCTACLAVASAAAQAPAPPAPNRTAAQQQFDRAESLRATLESQPAVNRTEQNYLQVVQAYRRVYYTTSHGDEVPASIFAVGSLYRVMGDRFAAKYYQSSVDAYQFLLHDYPTNPYREDALLAIGEIERDDLHDSALARKTFEDFLAQHPHSDGATEALQVIADIDADTASKSPSQKTAELPPTPVTQHSSYTAANAASAPADASRDAGELRSSASAAPSATAAAPSASAAASAPSSVTASGKVAEVTRIQTWNADTYTRIVIDTGSPVKYQAARIPGPDRIYFDLDHAHVNEALLAKQVDVQSGGFLKGVRVAQYQDGVVRVVLEVNQVKNFSVFLLDNPSRFVIDVYGASVTESARNSGPDAPPDSSAAPAGRASNRTSDRSSAHAGPYILASPDVNARRTPAPDSNAASAPPVDSAAVQPASTAMPQPIAKSKRESAASMRPPSIPAPMLDGQASLTRVLGLKVGRIVIDAGHGGHDTGTIGPSGLLEKDLCLDVALRLGALIGERLPGAEVIYTRDDDTFVPLEQRTAIATQAKADLFISIHANSSPDPSARGIETYYLNFSNNPAALAVAARENASYDGGVHDLQGMLQKIAQNEKIDESRDLAEDIQGALAKHMERVNPAEKDRGVRTAPFVVLIGANIPSVLAEIAFISNPADEQMMKKSDARQRVAEGLYQGIASYLQSTNSLTANKAPSEIDDAPAPLAQAGNRR